MIVTPETRAGELTAPPRRRLGNEADPAEAGPLHGEDRAADALVGRVDVAADVRLGKLGDVLDAALALDLVLELLRPPGRAAPAAPSWSGPNRLRSLPAPFERTVSDTFSGLVVVGSNRTLGRLTGTDWMTTGTVIRKMMSSTSMTSTSGVVLMSDIGVSSPPSEGPMLHRHSF